MVNGCIRFDQYVYGREITVQTDHKPLKNILKRPLLSQAPRRLQRMLFQLQRYHLKEVHKRGKELLIADTLSRAYLLNELTPEKSNCDVFAVQQEEYLIKCMEEIDMVEILSITAERIADLGDNTEQDDSRQKLKRVIKVGWPDKKEEVPTEIRNFFHFKEELTI